MANVTANLPLPALNGVGASVDTTGFGAAKTFIVAGSFPGATLIVEASTDGGGVFAPVVVFQDGDREALVAVVADHMRVRVSGRKTSVPFSASLEVGAPADTPSFIDIPLPALNGTGTAVDISTFPLFATIIAGGSFQGAQIIVEVSDDNVDFAPLVTFAGQGSLNSSEVTANWARARVSGRKSSVPFSGSLSLGAGAPPGGGGGGGGSTLDVQKDGVDVVNPATTLNFIGPQITVTDAGGGVADVQVASTAIVRTFRYVADGSETTAGFTVAIPAPPMADANYNAIVSQDALVDDLSFQMPHTSFTTTHLDIIPGADMTAGDQIYITLIPFVNS